jgi:hypothetical protein
MKPLDASTTFSYVESRMARPVRTVLAVLIITFGVAGFATFLITSLTEVFDGLQRVSIPGSRELALKPGEYTIYWDTDSRFASVPSRSDLIVTVVSSGGSNVSVSSPGLMTGRYSTMDGRTGVSIAALTVAEQGPHTVTVAAAAGKTLPRGGLAVGRSLGFLGILKIVLISLVLLGGSIGAGVALLVRSSARGS